MRVLLWVLGLVAVAVVAFAGWTYWDYQRTVGPVLHVLGPAGLDAMELRRRVGAMGVSTSGAFYGHLQAMERAGLVQSWSGPTAPGCCGVFYALTDQGLERLNQLCRGAAA